MFTIEKNLTQLKSTKKLHRYMRLIFSILFLSFELINNSFAMRPPQTILVQLEGLSKINAALMICFESAEYKNISNKEALKMHELTTRADEVIEMIERKYNDKNAYLAYMSATLQYKEDSEFIRNFNKYYSRKCAPQLVIDSEKSINLIRSNVLRITK